MHTQKETTLISADSYAQYIFRCTIFLAVQLLFTKYGSRQWK